MQSKLISPTQIIRLLTVALGVAAIFFKLGIVEGWHFFLKAIIFLVMISVIVFIHEFGHYIVAKLSGVKIEIFSIGFGRELLGWNDRSGTRWKIAAWPVGGYVKMYGDASEASTPLESIATLPEEEKRKTFYYKPLYKKALIVVAGPLGNFVLTIAIFTFFIATHGMPSAEPLIGKVMKDTPAQAAGILPGDRVLSVNGEHVDFFHEIPRLIITNLGTPVALELKRGDKVFSITLTPKEITEKDDLGNTFTHPLIGIVAKDIKFDKVGPRAVWEATRSTYYLCQYNLQFMGQMITGQRSASDNIKGPIGIAQLTGRAAGKGLRTLLFFVAQLSAGLGLLNLFPIPMLDGGHLLFYGVQALIGRPINRRLQEFGFRIGMAMIAMLMTYAILNDVRHLFPPS